MEDRPRPDGYDYSKPDPIENRCPYCNSDGMNRTGLRPIDFVGSSTISLYGVKCTCKNGLK